MKENNISENISKERLKKAMNTFYDKTTKAKGQDETEFYSLVEDCGNPSLNVSESKFKLQIGRNTVGRKCTPAQSTLQIPTSDKYMSRINAIIEVGKNLEGSWRVVIASCNENNLAKVNGRPLRIGDKIFLQAGDTITLGHTDMIFSFG